MNHFLTLFFFLFSLSSVAGEAHSHGSHSHTHKKVITQKRSKEIARTHVERLMKLSKIDKNWSNATINKIEKKKFGHNSEWVISFYNTKGVKGKKLFIFLTLSGDFVAANFSGK